MILSLLLAAAAPPPAAISAARIRADVATLASDAFAGRGPGEAGEARTVAWLAKAFADAGLEPAGTDGSWYQPVPLVRLDLLPGATVTLAAGGKAAPLIPGRDLSIAFRNAGRTTFAGLPLVFAGYGVVGQGHDDYAEVDLRGKVAVVLANDPDFDSGRDLGFEGRRMAYAGRIGVKAEAAAKAGAAGLLVIHEDAAASYPFAQLANGQALPAFAPAPLAPSALAFSGWLRGDVAARMLAAARLDLAGLKARARDPGFRAFALAGQTLSVDGMVKATPVVSRNVVGRLPGATRPREAVLYGAHWDANGTNGPDAEGDAIRNGAVDNATGTAELVAIARAFAAGPRPARTLIFAAWTAEEKGLLGAEHYAAHPLHPLALTAAVINLDPHVVLPAARNLELIGGGRTDLEARLRVAATGAGLRVDDEPAPEAGWYFRSDHFALAKRGVPALAFRAGRDLVDGGRAAGGALVADYNAHRYHQPSDAFDPAWTFAGTAQEARVAWRVGLDLANSADWPGWNAGVDYGVVRARTADQR